MTISIAKAKKLDEIQRTRESLNLPSLLIEEEEGVFVPTSSARDACMSMLLAGANTEQIAKVFGLSAAWVRKYFRYEIDAANTIANGKVANALYKNALSGDTQAQKFWLKAKANWRETRDEVDNPVLRITPVLNISISNPSDNVIDVTTTAKKAIEDI